MSMPKANKTNDSIDTNVSNDDDDVIPETQDLFSQNESVISLNSTNIPSQADDTILSVNSADNQDVTQIHMTEKKESEVDQTEEAIDGKHFICFFF